MKRRILCVVALALVAGFGIACAVPASRYRMLAYLRGEHLYNGRPVAYWVAALKDTEAPLRREAALTLGEADVAKECAEDEAACRLVVAGLVETLGDQDGFVRKCAATSLLTYPRQSTVPEDGASVARLLTALRDDEVAVRKAAARSLWQAGNAAAQADGVVRLTTALSDRDDFVREYAARALGRIGPDAKPAVPALLDRLRQDEERDVREHAAKSLGLIGAQAIGPLLAETIQALRQGLHDDAADVRENSARALGQLGAREAVADLRKTREDEQPRVRTAADEALKALEGAPTENGR